MSRYAITELTTGDLIEILKAYDSIDADPSAVRAWDEFTVGGKER